jgi:segregation and condensation protein B
MTDSSLTDIELNLAARLEALLFIAPGAVTAAQLAAVMDVPTLQIEKALDDLAAEYDENKQNRGLRLQRHRGRFQLTSAPEVASWVERFLGLETSSRLSRAGLETLAIIAYRQPVTRPQVDAIRGVNSDSVLKSLLSKGLIMESGRAEAVGRPILYNTTPEFMQYFGFNAIDELPPIETENGTGQVGQTGEAQGEI